MPFYSSPADFKCVKKPSGKDRPEKLGASKFRFLGQQLGLSPSEYPSRARQTLEKLEDCLRKRGTGSPRLAETGGRSSHHQPAVGKTATLESAIAGETRE